MHISAVVEVACEMEFRSLQRLVASAYRQSRSGLVVLALRGISRRTVDTLLDPIVSSVGLEVEGTLYLEDPEPASLLRFVVPGTTVVGCSERFRNAFQRGGAAVIYPDEAIRRWDGVETATPMPRLRAG